MNKLLKGLDSLSFGALEPRSRKRIKGYEIYLRRYAFQKFNEAPRVLQGIVYALYEHVLERDEPPVFKRILFKGFKQFINGIFFVYRHEKASHLVGRSVKRDRYVHVRFPAESSYGRNHPRGGKSHLPRRECHAFFVNKHPQKSRHLVVIIKRLAHAHQNHVRYRFEALYAAGAYQIGRNAHNAAHLGHGQVSSGPDASGHAKKAPKGAPGLSRDAKGEAFAFRY